MKERKIQNREKQNESSSLYLQTGSGQRGQPGVVIDVGARIVVEDFALSLLWFRCYNCKSNINIPRNGTSSVLSDAHARFSVRRGCARSRMRPDSFGEPGDTPVARSSGCKRSGDCVIAASSTLHTLDYSCAYTWLFYTRDAHDVPYRYIIVPRQNRSGTVLRLSKHV